MLVKGYVHQVVIVCGSEVIARHERSYERESAVYDPLHYLGLLEHKSRALEQAAPLAGWQLPDCFAHLRRLLEARLKKHGGREYIQVLRLLETLRSRRSLRRHRRRAADEHHQLRCRAPYRALPHRTQAAATGPAELAASSSAQVRTTAAADYMTLLAHVHPLQPPDMEVAL